MAATDVRAERLVGSALWTLLIGTAGAVATWLLNRSETPDDVRVLAIGFASYVLALVSSAFGAVRAAD